MRPSKHNHHARHFAHRVRESLATRLSKFLCSVFLSLLLIAAIILFILWLSLRPHRPRIHLHDFSVPGLTQPNGFENARITFNVTARNVNQAIGIYYDAMAASGYYRDEPIGSTPLPSPSYQEPKNTVVLVGELAGATLNVNNHRWMEFEADRARGTMVFRLEVTATIRFRISRWRSRRHRMHANCDVGLGPDGLILARSKDERCPVYFT